MLFMPMYLNLNDAKSQSYINYLKRKKNTINYSRQFPWIFLSLWLPTLFLWLTWSSFSSQSISLNACRQLPQLSSTGSSRAWTCPLLTGLSYFQTFYQFTCFPLNSLQFVFLFKHMISKTQHNAQVGLAGATQSSKCGLFLLAFRLKSHCIKVFAFIGNRFFFNPSKFIAHTQ